MPKDKSKAPKKSPKKSPKPLNAPKTPRQLTPEETKAIDAIRTRPDVFGATNCYIKTKKGGELVLFKPNEVQKILDAFVQIQFERNRQAWFIVLKARQFGVSTWGIKNQYARINFKKNHDTLFAAHDEDSTEKLFERARIMHDNNPEAYATKYSNKKEIKLVEQNSSMSIQTMGKGELGRSAEYKDVHLSELAFAKDADLVMTSIAATLPQEHMNHDSVFCIESTANGQGGTFYDLWCESTPLFKRNYCTLPKSASNRVGIFFPWFIFQDNQLKVPKGFVESLTDFDDDRFGNELELKDLLNLTDKQMAWRRWQIKDLYNGNLSKFTQENPATDSEAFLSTGRPVFAQNGLIYQRSRAVDPMYKCTITEDNTHSKSSQGCIEIYEPAVEGAYYVLGYDPAEGLDKEEKNDPDAGSCHVIRVDTKSVVAKINTQMELALCCVQVDRLGRYYNDAYLAFEVNNTMGGGARQIFKQLEYPHLYYRQEMSRITDNMTEAVGWRTDISSRGQLVSDLQEVIRDKLLDVRSKETCDELAYFIFNKNGKAEAKAGEHDDDVMSLGIAVQMLLKMIEDGKSTIVVSEPVEDYKDRPDYDGSDNFYTNSLARHDAIDNMEDMEDEDPIW